MSFIVILYNLELIQGNETFSTKTQVFKMFKPVLRCVMKMKTIVICMIV